MTDKYQELREAISNAEYSDDAYWLDRYRGESGPETIRGLLDERDRLLKELRHIHSGYEIMQEEAERLREDKARLDWVSVDDALPDMDVPVWLKTGHSVFIGGRVDHPDGWLWGRCYYEPWINKDGEWAGDIEHYDNHMVTAWHPLPVPPKVAGEDEK